MMYMDFMRDGTTGRKLNCMPDTSGVRAGCGCAGSREQVPPVLPFAAVRGSAGRASDMQRFRSAITRFLFDGCGDGPRPGRNAPKRSS